MSYVITRKYIQIMSGRLNHNYVYTMYILFLPFNVAFVIKICAEIVCSVWQVINVWRLILVRLAWITMQTAIIVTIHTVYSSPKFVMAYRTVLMPKMKPCLYVVRYCYFIIDYKKYNIREVFKRTKSVVLGW